MADALRAANDEADAIVAKAKGDADSLGALIRSRTAELKGLEDSVAAIRRQFAIVA